MSKRKKRKPPIQSYFKVGDKVRVKHDIMDARTMQQSGMHYRGVDAAGAVVTPFRSGNCPALRLRNRTGGTTDSCPLYRRGRAGTRTLALSLIYGSRLDSDQALSVMSRRLSAIP